jgi:hypothetical protein
MWVGLAVTGADNVADERAEGAGTADGVKGDTKGDVDIVVAARFGEVLRIMRSAPMIVGNLELTYLEEPEDLFLFANTAPTLPPMAPPVIKTAIMQRSQEVVGRKPQTCRERECEMS